MFSALLVAMDSVFLSDDVSNCFARAIAGLTSQSFRLLAALAEKHWGVIGEEHPVP
jgi:hypothetical protein